MEMGSDERVSTAMRAMDFGNGEANWPPFLAVNEVKLVIVDGLAEEEQSYFEGRSVCSKVQFLMGVWKTSCFERYV
jgi:hypothetical protein